MDKIVAAFQVATDIAKAVCTNPNCKVELNESSATQIADFIDALYRNILNGDATKEL